ncbi:hypothetical protein Tco_0918687 [Tanacetum coccineum]
MTKDVSDEEIEDGAKGKAKIGDEDLRNQGEWPMPVWCRMFQQTLDGKARAWFDKLPSGSIDNWGSLQEKFLNRFGMRKERWVSESNAIPNVPELMQISSFMSSHKCPELAKRFSDNVPKTVDEMLRRVYDYLRSEEAFRNTELPRGEFQRKDVPVQWVQRNDRQQRYPYGNSHRRQEHIHAFRAPERNVAYAPPQRPNQEARRPKVVLTLNSLSSTPQEILATEHQREGKKQAVEPPKERKAQDSVSLTDQVLVNPAYPEQLVAIGICLSPEGSNQLKNLLKENIDIFAWESSDMTGVPKRIIKHSLNANPLEKPVSQKRRVFCSEKSQVITEEVAEWLI